MVARDHAPFLLECRAVRWHVADGPDHLARQQHEVDLQSAGTPDGLLTGPADHRCVDGLVGRSKLRDHRGQTFSARRRTVGPIRTVVHREIGADDHGLEARARACAGDRRRPGEGVLVEQVGFNADHDYQVHEACASSSSRRLGRPARSCSAPGSPRWRLAPSRASSAWSRMSRRPRGTDHGGGRRERRRRPAVGTVRDV